MANKKSSEKDEIKNNNCTLDSVFGKNCQTIFEMLPEIVAILDNKGFLINVSSNILKTMGYTPKEIIGMNFLNFPFVSLQTKTVMAEKFTEIIKKGKITTKNIELISKDNKKHYASVSAKLVRDTKGKIESIIVLISDITKERAIEEALFESEERFKLLFDNAQDMIVMIDKDKKFININRKFLEESGCKKSHVGEKMTRCDILTNESAKRAEKAISDILQNKQWCSMLEVEGKNTKGLMQYYEFYAIPIKKAEETIAVLVMFRNITDKKEIMSQVRESEERYRLIAENTSDLISVLSLSLKPKYLYVNYSHTKLLGYNSDELIGKSAIDMVHPDDRKKILILLKKYISAQAISLIKREKQSNFETFEYRLRDSKGNYHLVESTGNVVGKKAIVVTREISRRVLS